MPRDGSGVYTLPPGTTVAPNTTIESSWANALTADLAQDANTARPITAGGTGSATASAARTALGVPGLADANTFTADQTITSTDAGASAGPVLNLYRNSASPAASDVLGKILFNGEDLAGNTQEYGSIEAVIADPANLSEDGALDFYTPVGGSRTRIMSVGPNLDLAAIGQIKFPATQNPSSNVNTLDDYEEGTWTPALTFATPGNLSISYTTQVGSYIKIGRFVMVSFTISASSFTHTTASGNAQITALPFTPVTNDFVFPGALQWQGITKAGYTDIVCRADNNSTTVLLIASGSGVTNTIVTAADMPTGGAVGLRGTITYLAQN